MTTFKMTFYSYIKGNPYYDYHYVTEDGKTIVVQYDGCGCGCEDYLFTKTFDVVDGIVTVNGVEYTADGI